MFDNGFNKQNDTICRFKFLKTRQNFMGGGRMAVMGCFATHTKFHHHLINKKVGKNHGNEYCRFCH